LREKFSQEENFSRKANTDKKGYTKSMWHVYILQCNDKTLYTGVTKSLTKRLNYHNRGKASKYTRGRTPVKMIYTEDHPTKTSALKREIQLKKWTKAKKLALIHGDKAKLSGLSKSRD
jgi:putative endonuclease